MVYESIVISSGHSTKCQGAVGPSPWGLNEVAEATKVVNRVGVLLLERGVDVTTFSDTVSTSQSQNLDRIVDFHNDQGTHDLDVSIHFNASGSGGHGTEVLWVTQEDLARDLSAVIAAAGHLTDRGPKYRDDLAFLNGTNAKSVLLEIAFVDHQQDCSLYREHFEAICSAIADVLGGPLEETIPPPERPGRPTRPPIEPTPVPRVDIQVTGEVLIFVNGTQCGTKG